MIAISYEAPWKISRLSQAVRVIKMKLLKLRIVLLVGAKRTKFDFCLVNASH
jgi:hypothetical protein